MSIRNLPESSISGLEAKAPVASPTFTGVAAFPLGSAALPSIVPTGDTNTGIWSPAADTLAVSTAGAERMRITSAGNVGIGTSSPLDRLHVAGGIRSARFTTDAAGNALNFRKSRGTESSPTIVASGDTLGQIQFWGYDGAADQYTASILAGVDGTPGAGDMPSRLTFFTTPDGGTSITERMRIDNAGLITGTGTSLGAWTAYTPTLGGTGWAIGNGTVEGEYVQIGKIVHARGTINFNSTSTFGAGNITISLPISRANRGATPQVTLLFNDVSVSKGYLGTGYIVGNGTTATLSYLINGTNGEVGAVVSSTPFTWASLDQIFFSFTYQAS